MTEFDHEFDVVIVGSGAAALATALGAVDEGLSAVMLESSDKWGGNSNKSGAECGCLITHLCAATAPETHAKKPSPTWQPQQRMITAPPAASAKQPSWTASMTGSPRVSATGSLSCGQKSTPTTIRNCRAERSAGPWKFIQFRKRKWGRGAKTWPRRPRFPS